MTKTRDIALGILNNVIWIMYKSGYHLAAKLIEDMRDREAIDIIKKIIVTVLLKK